MSSAMRHTSVFTMALFVLKLNLRQIVPYYSSHDGDCRGGVDGNGSNHDGDNVDCDSDYDENAIMVMTMDSKSMREEFLMAVGRKGMNKTSHFSCRVLRNKHLFQPVIGKNIQPGIPPNVTQRQGDCALQIQNVQCITFGLLLSTRHITATKHVPESNFIQNHCLYFCHSTALSSCINTV